MGAKSLTQQQAVNRIKEVHGDTYDLSNFVYTLARNKVRVGCKKHGDFAIRYADFASGAGCIHCGNERKIDKLIKSFDEFVKDAQEKHGDKYSYVESTYRGTNQTIDIVCPVHGVFSQKAGRHSLKGCGCPKCQLNGFNRANAGYLYLLTNGVYIKIGITNRAVNKRIKEINKTLEGVSPFKLVQYLKADGEYVYNAEQHILNAFSSFRTENLRFSGNTEAFRNEVFYDINLLFTVFRQLSPPVGTVEKSVKVRKSMSPSQVKEKRRKDVLDKTGVPVGVVFKNNSWLFQQTRRNKDGVKYKKPIGRFKDKQTAINFAIHFYETSEILDTRDNLLVYNDKGLLYGIKMNGKKFEVNTTWSTLDGERVKRYLGLFETREAAEDVLLAFRKRLDSGEFGEIHRPKFD